MPSNETQKGFSLVELLVAMTLMVIVLAAAFSMLNISLKASAQTYEMTDAQQGLRIAQDFINRDLITAGDGFFGVSTISVPNGFVANYITLRPNTEYDADGDGISNLRMVMSDNDITAGATVPSANGAPVPLMPNTDRFTTMTVDRSFTPIQSSGGREGGQINVPFANNDVLNVGEIYYVSDGITSTFAVLTAKNPTAGSGLDLYFDEGDALGLNNLGAASPLLRVIGNRSAARPLMILRASLVQYYVTQDGMLHRRVFGVRGSLYVDGLIAEHLTQFRIRYFLDQTDTNSMTAPVTQLAMVGTYIPVRIVESRITVASVNPDPQGNPRTVSALSVTSVRNLQFRESPNLLDVAP